MYGLKKPLDECHELFHSWQVGKSVHHLSCMFSLCSFVHLSRGIGL